MNQIQKLYGVNSNLGLDLSTGQQTTRIVYDTEPAGAATGYLELFANFANKSRLQTNLTEPKLTSQESMVVKEIIFSLNNPIAKMATFDFLIGSQKVLKDIPITFATNAGLDWSPLNIGSTTRFSVRLITDLVIPPQVSFRLNLRSAPAAFAANTTVAVALKGFGVLFNPQSTL